MTDDASLLVVWDARLAHANLFLAGFTQQA